MIKNMIKLYGNDIKRIFSSKSSIVFFIMTLIIPSMIAWIGISGLWSPASNMDNLRVAVFSDDERVQYKNRDVQLGSQIIKDLENNNDLKWSKVENKDELLKGVKSGKYYAGIYIPRTFSENIIKFAKGEIIKPKIEYYTNRKLSYSTSKDIDNSSGSMVQSISDNFLKTASESVLKETGKMGADFKSRIPMIKKAKNFVFAFENNEAMIDEYTENILYLNDKLPEINRQVEQSKSIVGLFPDINKSANSLVAMNYRMEDIEVLGEIINSLGSKRNDLHSVGSEIENLNLRLDELETVLSDGIVGTKNMIDLIESSQNSIKRISDSSKNVDTLLSDTNKFVYSLESTFRAINSTIDNGLNMIDLITNSIINEMGYLAEKVSGDFSERDMIHINRSLRAINDNTKRDLKVARELRDIVVKIESIAGANSIFSDIISRMNNNITILESIVAFSDSMLQKSDNFDPDSIRSDILKLQVFISDLAKVNQDMKSLNMSEEIGKILVSVIDGLQSSSDLVQDSRLMVPKLYGLMDSSKTSLKDMSALMEEYKNKLPTIRSQISNISDMLGLGIEGINSSLNRAISFYTFEFPHLKNNMARVSDFIQYQLPGIENDIEREIESINSVLPRLNTAVGTASEFILNDYPKLKESNRKIAKFLRDSEKDIELEDALNMLSKDFQKENDFLSNPMTIINKDLYPVKNYGTSVASFFIAMSIWIAGIILSESIKGKFSDNEGFFSRLLTFTTIGVVQSLIVSLGCVMFLGLKASNSIGLIITSMIVSSLFLSIIFSIVTLLSNIGKVIVLVILGLSVSINIGAFPIEVYSLFSRIISAVLPFTYGKNLINESIGGIYALAYIKNLAVLLMFTVLTVVLRIFLYKPISEKLNKVESNNFFKI